jgi:FdhE protein
MTIVADVSPYVARRDRARELGARYGFAAEPLTLYVAVVSAQERIFERARHDRPDRGSLAEWVVRRALPDVMEAAVAAGTEKLREATLVRFHEADLERSIEAWLSDPDTADSFLARASTQPVLEALPELAAAVRPANADERSCPRCGGAPQLAVFPDTGEALLTAQRLLVCARCAHEWTASRMTCASCGETSGARMPILSDVEVFPHLRIDACETCRRYLMTVDLRKDAHAVPLVDELAALPLDLIAAERGFTKITPNLMGF